ncbi:MAG: class I SAM-dependent methyltransferase [Anaerolineae bacterium]|nr:class I SAM-dependent methyltransferase [Anaerolineae bacterium]
MNHTDHVNLIHAAIPNSGGVWADFGAGGGAFTLALAECIGASGTIYAIDQDSHALRQNQQAVASQFPSVETHYLTADFTKPLTLPPLDGLVAANTLHFHRHKEPILHQLISYLKPGGHFIIVEYNIDNGNQWVPYPFTYFTWAKLAASVGLADTHQLALRPSRFLHEIYSAASIKPLA